MSFYFLQINRTAAVPPPIFFPGVSRAILSHLRGEISPPKDDQSHRNVASREPLCGRRANPINFREIKKQRARARPSKVFFFPFFFFQSSQLQGHTYCYLPEGESLWCPSWHFFFLFNFQGQICAIKERKKASKGSVVCEFVNSCGLSSPGVEDGCGLNRRKSTLPNIVDAHPCWSNVGLKHCLSWTCSDGNTIRKP